jgi:hypothetical protein
VLVEMANHAPVILVAGTRHYFRRWIVSVKLGTSIRGGSRGLGCTDAA